MIVGKPAFEDENPSELYMKIMYGEIEFPSFVKPEAKDLICQLLDKDPATRLGC